MYGTTGIGYAKSAHPTVDSWKVMFDEKNAGKILMLDDSRECIAVALKVMGKSINEKDPAILKQAGDMLKAQKKLVKAYDADDFSGVLERGDVTLAHGFNGQLAKVAAKDKSKFAFVVPKEGATLWIDTFCIPAKAKNTAEAHELLNYILEPEVNAKIVNEVSYASSNLAAKKLVKPEIGNDPSVYPPDDVIARCEMMVDLGDEVMAVIDKIWEEVTAK
jgi:spermidine/putrescine-binding protein